VADLMAQMDMLKGLSDQSLAQEMGNPSGAVPPYLILSEVNRRKDMRQRYAGQAALKQPASTVANDIVSALALPPNMGAPGQGAPVPPMQGGIGSPPAPMPPGAPSPSMGIAGPPQGMKHGGIVGYAGGGYVGDPPMVDQAPMDRQALDGMFGSGPAPQASFSGPTTVDYSGIAGQYQQMLQREEASRARAPWLALIDAGGAMAAGTSPNALSNIGTGIQSGLKSYTGAIQGDNTTQGQIVGAQLGLAQAQQAQANEVFKMDPNSVAPLGYRRMADGTLQAISGGPDDPSNPLNAYKTMGMGGGLSAGSGIVPGTTGSPTIDPAAPGYSTVPVVGGLTQAAIDQKAQYYQTIGGVPPQGRSGIMGMQNAAIANRMAELDPSGNLGTNKAQMASLASSLKTQQTYLDATQRSVGNAENGFQQVISAFQNKGINASQYPSINAAVNAAKAQLSPGDISAYNAGLQEIANEYAQVFSRGGQMTDQVRTRAASIANGNLNLDDLKKVLTELQAQGDIVVKGAQGQVKHITDQINGIIPRAAAAADTSGAGSAPADPLGIR
jgi:hypothetical protein